MDRAKTIAKVNQGYGKLGNKVGRQCDFYRAINGSNPLAVSNNTDTSLVFFDSKPNLSASSVNTFGHPLWYGSFDQTDTLPGDYLVTDEGLPAVSYIAAQQDFLPALLVACNDVLTFYRPKAKAPSTPDKFYSGNTANAGRGELIAASWPASVLQGTKGEKAALNLPLDTRQPWFSILLPSPPGVMIRTSDQIEDERGNRLTVSSVEPTDLGLRLTASYAEA